MTDGAAVAADHAPSVAHFPLPLFAASMGLLGFTLALQRVEAALGLGALASGLALGFSVLVFLATSAGYLTKALRHRDEVKGDWNHPVRIAFFPAISISVLLLATAVMPSSESLARGLWIIGAAGQAALTLAVVANWIGARAFLAPQLSPAWFIPAVGNVIAPIAGAHLGLIELSWYFFSVGMIFWVVLLTLVMNRLMFHEPLPGKLQPTLVILIAPPAVGFVAYVNLAGGVDGFARVMINAGYLFFLVVLTQARAFGRIPFALSFWALSFPVAALAIASFVFARETGSGFHLGAGYGLSALLSVIIAVLVLRTAKAALGGHIFKPE
ncbi:MAG: tellurite resistance protein [Rhodobacteraceae bacterium HLUCCA08]|nr:MAG: tellurite resistance protein [Rhodobacteraceae bacterium HLUCCA08]